MIRESKSVPKALAKAPEQIRDKYEVWKRIVRQSGPHGVAVIPGFHDEALKGDWTGYRSSRLSQAYRVIYQTRGAELLVLVERVSKHDYRK